jgi:hypothetical protein
MYQENATVKKDAEDKLVEVEDQLSKYAELLSTIYTKFGFVKTEVATKVKRKSE